MVVILPHGIPNTHQQEVAEYLQHIDDGLSFSYGLVYRSDGLGEIERFPAAKAVTAQGGS